MLRPAILKLAPVFAAAAAVALYCALSILLTGTLTPWSKTASTKGGTDLETSALPNLAAAPPATPPAPTLVAVRKSLSELATRKNVAPAYAEDLAGATAFYGTHTGPLLWVTESGMSERGNSVVAEIRKADDWGLRAGDFALPQLPAGAVSPEVAAAAEIELTFAVLKYARFARGGRWANPASLSKLLDYTPPVRPPKDVLADIAASDAPDAYLRSLHPRHAQFDALRRLLLKLRKPGDAGEGEIAYGEKLGTALPQLVRAEASDASAASSLEPRPDNAQTTLKISRILVNMERWRWLPADLGEFYVWNNVPEFLTRVVRKGEIIHSDRIVAGQPEWPTPAFSADMKTIVFHPSWGVPDGIKRKELWPRLRNSSGGDLIGLFTGSQSSRAVLEAHKLEAYYQGRPIDPNQVDWGSVNIGAYEFRQAPGPTNVLGAIKFLFPNKHDIYMHDTPDRTLFGKQFRGLSHGCMRVENPRKLAAVLLAQDKGWSEQQVAGMLGGGTREVELATHIPVHMTYFTAVVGRDGNLQTFADLYGIDTRMGAALFGKKVPFVTPRYDAEIAAMRASQRTAAASGAQPLSSLADAITDIFSP